jgi:RNA recognition motif-containing protein
MGNGSSSSGKRLYVGNLSYQTTESAIREAFEKGPDGDRAYTVTDIKMVNDRETGQFRGFAFVEFQTREQALAAAAEWDGQDLDGRTLKVNEATPKPGNGKGGGGGGHGRDDRRYDRDR